MLCNKIWPHHIFVRLFKKKNRRALGSHAPNCTKKTHKQICTIPPSRLLLPWLWNHCLGVSQQFANPYYGRNSAGGFVVLWVATSLRVISKSCMELHGTQNSPKEPTRTKNSIPKRHSKQSTACHQNVEKYHQNVEAFIQAPLMESLLRKNVRLSLKCRCTNWALLVFANGFLRLWF